MAPALHDDLASLAFLLGTWRGEGDGEYPTIEPFRYGEELVFEHVGDPFLLYRQSSWLLDDGSPLHFERGFLRPGAEPDGVELTLAHPLGLTEVAEGAVSGTELWFVSTSVVRTHTGSAVTALQRRYRLDAEVLSYEIDMAMDETAMTRHLVAQLRRADG
jgi:THAP4-like, heme-binding beta-barrel domain